MLQMQGCRFASTSPGDKRVFQEIDNEGVEYKPEISAAELLKSCDLGMSSSDSEPLADQRHDNEPLIEPHENDVLMGRGGRNNQHSGNQVLRNVASDHCERYRVSSKKGKSHISRQLVHYMRELDPPTRFLRKDPVSGWWEDVGDDVAREKASQVLRDAVAAQEEAPTQFIVSLPTLETEYPATLRRHFGSTSEGVGVDGSSDRIRATPIRSSNRAKRARHDEDEYRPSHSSSENYQNRPASYGSTGRRLSTSPYNLRTADRAAPLAVPSMAQRQGSTATAGSAGLLGDVQSSLIDFDLFNGELLDSDTEERANPYQR